MIERCRCETALKQPLKNSLLSLLRAEKISSKSSAKLNYIFNSKLKMRQSPYHFVFYPLLVLLLLLQFFHNFGHSCSPRSGYNRRKPTKPLYLKQRVPDTEEFSLDASGRARGKITRNSSKFNTQLVSCYMSDIVFKDEEGTGADRLMTKVRFVSFVYIYCLVFQRNLTLSMATPRVDYLHFEVKFIHETHLHELCRCKICSSR